MMRHDFRRALRTIAKQPLFAAAVVVSLALGIGASTAVFTAWYGVLHAPLPGVRQPDGLVMLSNPDHGRMIRGRWFGRRHGPRPLFTYAEFVQLRDQVGAIAEAMASQAPLFPFNVRVDGGRWEEAAGRLVSDNYFQVLGVDAAIGRLFTVTDAQADARPAVISHSYWQQRFGGDPTVIGRSIVVSEAVLTIIGVTRAGFVGETRGQQPAFWMPIHLQPDVLGGRDLLHDTPPAKFMWLHMFARLKPGVARAQAEAEANAVFQAGLAAFYGASDSEAAQRELLDERLLVRPGGSGASPTRGEMSTSLTVLLAAVAVLLVIACVNLANLLLVRGVARQSEVAIRLAIGATPASVRRQIVIEALVLSALGGLAAIVVAQALHGMLIRLLARTDPRFHVAFTLDGIVLAFVAAAAAIAGLVVAMLPAWYATRIDVARNFNADTRGATAPRGRTRAGRVLASIQLALSFPLLVGAGLLIRTVDNLQHAELGFDRERLLVVRVDALQAAPELTRRGQLIDELRSRLQAIPGVQAVSFSRLGLFAGTNTTTTIEVEGFAARDESDRETGLDVVGARYFSTLGVPVVQGREILESDGDDAAKVCVINQAFADRFFQNRNPLGLQVTTVADNGPRTTYRIVGVARNARTQGLREEPAPRVFLPGEQRLTARPAIFLVQDYPSFLIRTHDAAAPLVETVRRAIELTEPAPPILTARSLEDQLAPVLAQDRTTAQLALVFGLVALILAGVGLYGVLRYGVARRSMEIAIRMAVGAHPARIVGMILSETLALLVAGLTLGAWLAYLGSRLIESRLYGVNPFDPLTVAVAMLVLLGVAMAAAYMPARSASRLDPVVVLHQA